MKTKPSSKPAATESSPDLKSPVDGGSAPNQNGAPAKQNQQGASTVAVHAGEARQKPADSITDPIFPAATYTFTNTKAVIDYLEQKQDREEYGRYGNPSERVVERKLAALEGGESALLFSTGMSALVVLLLAKLNSGDEVVFFDECYHRSREFCTKHLARFGVVTRQVKACDYDAMDAAITPKTKLLISESPTNPHLSVVDLDRFAEIGRRHDVETLIDATLGTPFNIRPLAAGIDYVLHSATKYLGGHNDLLAGARRAAADDRRCLAWARAMAAILQLDAVQVAVACAEAAAGDRADRVRRQPEFTGADTSFPALRLPWKEPRRWPRPKGRAGPLCFR